MPKTLKQFLVHNAGNQPVGGNAAITHRTFRLGCIAWLCVMANLLEVKKVLKRLERVISVLQGATSIRLRSFLQERGKQPMQDSEESRAYEKGFNDGLNAGLSLGRVELADLEVDEICEAFNGEIEDA